MVVVIEKNVNGKIEFTKEELEELLEKARQEGVREGSKQNYIYTTPSNPSPLEPNSPFGYQFTCGTPKTIATSENKLNGAPVSNGI